MTNLSTPLVAYTFTYFMHSFTDTNNKHSLWPKHDVVCQLTSARREVIARTCGWPVDTGRPPPRPAPAAGHQRRWRQWPPRTAPSWRRARKQRPRSWTGSAMYTWLPWRQTRNKITESFIYSFTSKESYEFKSRLNFHAPLPPSRPTTLFKQQVHRWQSAVR